MPVYLPIRAGGAVKRDSEPVQETPELLRRGTKKVRNSGLGPDPDQSAKNGPEYVRNWAQGPDLVFGCLFTTE